MWPFGRKPSKTPAAPVTKEVDFPKDYFSLVTVDRVEDDGTKGSPLFLIINTPYVGFERRDIFQWVLTIWVSVRKEEGGGMPTGDEAEVLNAMEDKIYRAISPENQQKNAIFVLRETDCDVRTIYFAVYDAELANSVLQTFLKEARFDLPWEFRMEADQDWKAMEFHFKKYIEAAQGGHLH
jgi:Family of unknown function (DUF695)